ncbi:MAG: hypothetical protein Kow0029_25980 [Candidatus Rifleibacteriota bacterium]
MVEVAAKAQPLRIPVWKYILFLLMLLLLCLVILYFLFGSNFGARNSFLETLRRYLSFANSIHPNIKPEDDFKSALRIHGFEKADTKRFYLFISATDKNGAPVKVINPAETTLKIMDNKGKELRSVIDRIRPLHLYDEWKDPISFSSVMDYSGSMFPEDVKAIENNFSTLINAIAVPFSAAVLKFNDRVREILNLTEDKNLIIDAIKKQVPLQNTALYDGIEKGVEKIQARPHFRFIVLTTDGNDNASVSTYEEAIRRCRQHDISIFAFGFGWLDVDTLKRMSYETNGYYSYVPDSSNLAEWFKKTAEIINNVQVIEFSTDVDLNMPGKAELNIDVGGEKLSKTKTWL